MIVVQQASFTSEETNNIHDITQTFIYKELNLSCREQREASLLE